MNVQVLDALEIGMDRIAQMQLLNQMLHHIIDKNGGKMTISVDALDPTGMGGIQFDIDGNAGTITLTTVTTEQVQAMGEAREQPEH